MSDITSMPFLDKLRVYYERLFPADLMSDWLGYSDEPSVPESNVKYDGTLFARREFSFTLEGDIYIRYQSFADAKQWRESLAKRMPVKMDIGCSFDRRANDDAKGKGRESLIPIEKELVFDIDMTDYDDVRTCCEGAAICDKCWMFMTIAVRILDMSLRDEFGFHHILWVYSGRRGIHAWVCDASARCMNDETRSSVAEYLQIVRGGSEKSRKVMFGKFLHPFVKRMFDEVIKPNFEELIVNNQRLFDSEKHEQEILKMIMDAGLRSSIETAFQHCKSGQQKWNVLREKLQKGPPKQPNVLAEIMFALIYPRLDINVSKQLNHLLKSPFCVHPKTGRICVPFDGAKADQFNPFDVPTLDEVLTEYNNASDSGENAWKATALRGPVGLFKDDFLKGLHKELRQIKADRKRGREVM